MNSLFMSVILSSFIEIFLKVTKSKGSKKFENIQLVGQEHITFSNDENTQRVRKYSNQLQWKQKTTKKTLDPFLHLNLNPLYLLRFCETGIVPQFHREFMYDREFIVSSAHMWKDQRNTCVRILFVFCREWSGALTYNSMKK